jgi:WD40 repeat protein
LYQVLCCSALDANTVLTCSSDGTVHLIDLRQPPLPATFHPNTRVVPQSLGGGPVDTLNARCASRTPLLNMKQQVYAVDWNRSNGFDFVAASSWGDLRVYDTRKGFMQSHSAWWRLFQGLDKDEVTGCAWSKDGRRLVGSWLNGSAYSFDVAEGICSHLKPALPFTPSTYRFQSSRSVVYLSVNVFSILSLLEVQRF